MLTNAVTALEVVLALSVEAEMVGAATVAVAFLASAMAVAYPVLVLKEEAAVPPTAVPASILVATD